MAPGRQGRRAGPLALRDAPYNRDPRGTNAIHRKPAPSWAIPSTSTAKKMKRVVKHLGSSVLGALKQFPTPLASRSNVERLIKRLQPRTCAAGLVRLGPAGDGGYLVPNDLLGIEACFSPGVSTVSGFEEDCANRGMEVFMADRSVDAPATHHERFHFTKKFIGATTMDGFMAMDEWARIAGCSRGSDLLLQMDIEGCEYEALLGTSDELIGRFRIIVVEFHWLDMLWSKPFHAVAASAFEKILKGHTCVHVHPNNCCSPVEFDGLVIPPVMEFTFLRNDRLGESSYAQSFPHPLDGDNTSKPHLVLPPCWIGARG